MTRRVATFAAWAAGPLCCLALALATFGLGSSAASAASPAADHSTSGTAATTGSTSQPQPASNADFSGQGANIHGPYDSTRNGAASQNGNGNGSAVGKPCAGCVGKADNKNPAGQMPNGSDRNAGYECDRNHGIGRTNPAHTGCTTAPTATTTPTGPTTSTTVNTSSSAPLGGTTPPQAGTPNGTSTGAASGSVGLSAGTDEATGSHLSALPGSDAFGQAAVASASPAAASRANSGRLAFTGTDAFALLVAALLSLAAGAVFVAYSRHRRTAPGH